MELVKNINNYIDEEIKPYQEKITSIIDNIETVIVGKRTVVELVVLSLISRGHVLIEDIPWVGKTSLVSALSNSIDCEFKRIQFTPDVMPSDITGFSIFNQKTGEFEFRPGSAMSNIVLADEINRASAKTQSSMLEIMEEKQVTVESNTYHMKEPFMVLATQNPIESLGTYPLPDAQLDRFLIKISIGYPSIEEEIKIVSMKRSHKKTIEAVASAQDIIDLRHKADTINVDPLVTKYIVEIVNATRNTSDLLLGSSPRGGIALYNICKAYALCRGRSYVIPDDVKYLAPSVLAHRVILSHDAKINKRTATQIINSILSKVAVPIMKLN